MQTSENLNELAAALAKAQGEITGALKDSANPFFKSKYADLASCWDACRGPLSKNGLSVTQHPQSIREMFNAQGEKIACPLETYLTTTLLHSSGQWMRSSLIVQPKDDTPQGMGSALSYARRYGLCAVVGVAQVDDDGNAASGRSAEVVQHTAEIPVDEARTHALAMIAIITRVDMPGDHDGKQRALEALDYHDRYLTGGNKTELYKAIYKQMDVPKRNIWKTLVEKAKDLQKADQLVEASARKW